MVFSQIGLAVPAFWAGILLILLFAVTLHWFPAGGFQPWQVDSHQNIEIPSSSCPLLGIGESCCAHPNDTILHA